LTDVALAKTKAVWVQSIFAFDPSVFSMYVASSSGEPTGSSRTRWAVAPPNMISHWLDVVPVTS